MKTKEEILEQVYVTPQDIKMLIPTLGILRCRELIDETRIEMHNKKFFVPNTKPKIALTKLVIKKLGM